jgi:aspartyl-tRNA(Asn)/glutamyl-tRNA(Gln) amidotransferase subunit C
VDFGHVGGIRRLEEAIAFAQPLLEINTTGIEPMYTVLEDATLVLRDDVVTEGNCKNDLLANATVSEEDFFVAPPGNLPLQQRRTKKNLAPKRNVKTVEKSIRSRKRSAF